MPSTQLGGVSQRSDSMTSTSWLRGVRATDATDPDTALRACGFVPLIASTTDRSTFAVRNSQPDDQPIGEIAVDRVAFDIAGRTLRLHVVEVEATGNGTADVVRDVTHALTESFGTTLRHWPANKVRTALLDCVGMKQLVVVDMSAVAYIDSSGVASLVEAFQSARKGGTRFLLAQVSEAALRVLELARLDKVFTIIDSVEDGLANAG